MPITPDFFTKDAVEIKGTLTAEVPGHEILLSFNSDAQAVAFCYWWSVEGLQAFGEWTIDNGDNYR